jgi:branched-chain amino acid transport system permease protein
MVLLIAQALLNGVLLGGIYAVYSAGFSLIFGVMKVINVAHGEFVMLGAFVTYWLFVLTRIDPFLTAPIAMAALFALGYLLQRLVIHRVVAAPPLMSLLLTFGISLVIANTASAVWTTDFRMVTTSYAGTNFSVGGLVVPAARVATFGVALLVVALLYAFLQKTEVGRAIRATAQDRDMARLMGVDCRRIFAMTFAVGAAITGLAGSLVTAYFPIFPNMGATYTLFAFCVVVLGGMGYIPGALWGGLALGIIQSMSGTFLSAGISFVITFVVLYLMLVLRPAGLTGRGLVE